MALNKKYLFFIPFWGASLIVVLAISALGTDYIIKFLLVFLALALDIIAFSSRYYTYFFGPLTRMKKNTVVLDDEEPFTIAPSGTAIVVREGQEVYATSYVKVPLYVSATEMENDDKLAFTNLFGRILSLTKEPVRLTSQLYIINKDQYVESIRRKLNESEDRYNTLASSSGGLQTREAMESSKSERIRGEVTMWRNILESVEKARSHALVTYASISVVGSTEDEAINLAMTKADELASGISAVLGITATIVTGTEILSFIEPDYMIPVTNVSERLKEKSIDRGI